MYFGSIVPLKYQYLIGASQEYPMHFVGTIFCGLAVVAVTVRTNEALPVHRG